MRVAVLILSVTLLAGCLNSGGEFSKVESNPKGSDSSPMNAVELSGMSFHTSYVMGLEEASASGKAVFLYFMSDTCPWCKKFEEEVLPKERVKRTIQDNFVLVAIDVYASDNLPLLTKYRIQGTPTMIFLNQKGEVVQGVIGFQDESEFLQVLDIVLKK